jgi:NAD(P)H-dependent flavin oxidoreductase YrpB (nitropropane dioxygenase family)
MSERSSVNIEVPVLAPPMGFISGRDLAAAVSNAGGLGIMIHRQPPLLWGEIA